MFISQPTSFLTFTLPILFPLSCWREECVYQEPWFSLAGCEVPTKDSLSLPLLSCTGEKKNTIKVSWVEIRTGRDH